MLAFSKFGMYLGLVLLIAPAAYHYGLRAEAQKKHLIGLSIVGFLLLASLSVWTLALAPIGILGRFDWAFFTDYARNSAQGIWTGLRLLAGIGLMPLLLLKPRVLSTIFVSSMVAILIASFSTLSHTASLGVVPFGADFLHALAASIWVGLVIAVSILPNWNSAKGLAKVMLRLSRVAQLAVLVLAVTGVYGAVVNLPSLSALWSSRYGISLLLKTTFFCLALSLAALNHWRYLPKLLAGGQSGFRRALYLEILFMLAVLAMTGLLSVTDPI